MAEVLDRVPREEIFARTGIQFLPFNTVYQLYAHVKEGLPAAAPPAPDDARPLSRAARRDHARANTRTPPPPSSSTPHTGRWDDALFQSLGLPRELMPELARPGDRARAAAARAPGRARPARRSRSSPPPPTTPGSAVAGTPLRPGWAYISSGTWSLVGVERDEPLVNPDVARASFTNEGGAFGTVRFLKNVMGLWILESCRREWAERRLAHGPREPARGRGGHWTARQGVLFPDDPRFFNPPSMLAAVRAALVESGQPAPDDPARLTRVILDSLALRYASVIATIEDLTGASHPRHPCRGRGQPQRVPEPGHRRCHGQAGSGRARGGHRRRQRAGPGHCVG